MSAVRVENKGPRAAEAAAALPRPWFARHGRSAIVLGLQVALLAAMTGSVATRTWQDRPWLGFLLVGATVATWTPELRRTRARRWWFAYVAGTFLYTLLRSYADETGVPIRTNYVIEIDRLLFLGVQPVSWLQGRMFTPGAPSLFDWAAVVVHWSFFIAPHATAVAIYIWRRELFPRYTVLMVLTLYSGLLLFFLVPTSPPWMAGSLGELPGAFRVMDFVGGQASSSTYQALYNSLGEPNSVAAVPSIHMAITFAMYLWARDHYPRIAPLLLAYAAIMGFALVYLAEHYGFDLLTGIACALLCHLASRRLTPLAAPAPPA